MNTSRDGRGIHSLSGQLFQHLTALSVKNFPLASNLNLPSPSLKCFPLSLAMKDIFLISNLNFPSFFPLAPLWVSKGCYQVTSEPSLLRAEQPQLSQPVLTGEAFDPSVLFFFFFLWPSSACAPTGPCLFCTEGSSYGHSTPGEATSAQSRGAGSLLFTC